MEGGTLKPDVHAQCTATVLRETPSRTPGRGPRPECPLQIQLVLDIMYEFNIACCMHRRFACSDRTEPPSLPPKREMPAPGAAGARPSFKPTSSRRGGRTALPPPHPHPQGWQGRWVARVAGRQKVATPSGSRGGKNSSGSLFWSVLRFGG